LNPLVIDANDAERQLIPGGQLMITTEVENYPGFSKGIQGPELMAEFREQALRFGTEILDADIERVDLSERPFKLYTREGRTIEAETLIIASGARAKWVGIPGLVVVGGGDTAMEEATFLTRYASHVFVVHRRDSLRASKIMQDKAKGNEKIEFIWNTEVREILGTMEDGVTGVRLFNRETNEETVFPCDGVFIAIGHKPNTELFEEQLEMDDIGYLKTNGHSMATNVPGVFACGDVQDSFYRQAITAAGTGCMAAIDAERYLDSLPVQMPGGEEITIEGEVVTPDHKKIIMPDGEVVSNKVEVSAGD
jgi:thioredoxin reductase (NADPH)